MPTLRKLFACSFLLSAFAITFGCYLASEGEVEGPVVFANALIWPPFFFAFPTSLFLLAKIDVARVHKAKKPFKSFTKIFIGIFAFAFSFGLFSLTLFGLSYLLPI